MGWMFSIIGWGCVLIGGLWFASYIHHGGATTGLTWVAIVSGVAPGFGLIGAGLVFWGMGVGIGHLARIERVIEATYRRDANR